MSTKTLTITIENWDEWVDAYSVANGNEPDELCSDEWVLGRMKELLYEPYLRGKREKKQREVVDNKNIVTIQDVIKPKL